MNRLIKNYLILPVLLLVLGPASVAYAAGPGSIDPTFDSNVYGYTSGTVLVTKTQSDGKILLGGTFTEINGRAATCIARLNTDGTVDTTFNPPDFLNSGGIGGTISAIGIQSDGRIVVGGNFVGVAGDTFGRGIRRLNPDGTLDTTFSVFPLDLSNTVRDMIIQPDDKIVVGGSAGSPDNFLRRLNADGTPDPSFSVTPIDVGTAYALLLVADGKLLVGGPSSVKRLNSNGSLDNSFASIVTDNGAIHDLGLRSDGKVVIGGVFSQLNGTPVGRVALLNSDGTPDFTFNQGNPGANGSIFAVQVLTDGKILIGGAFSGYNSLERQKVARLNSDGTLDTSFGNNPTLFLTFIEDTAVFPDGRAVIGNSQVNISPAAVILNTNGLIDVTRELVLSLGGFVRRVLVLSSGKIMIAGQFTYVNGVRRQGLARLNPDGTLDLSFVPFFNNVTAVPISLNAVVEQPDGKLLVGGINGFKVQRLNADGSQDLTFVSPFDSASTVYDIALEPDGRITVVGSLTPAPDRRVRRLLPNGTNDDTFEAGLPNNNVYCLVRQPDGKLLIGGDFVNVGGIVRQRVARLNETGSLDTSFDTTVGASGTVFNLALQPNGKVVVAGTYETLGGSTGSVRIGRLNADGSRDTSFSQSINGNVIGLALQRDGKILVGGAFNMVGGVMRNGIARLHVNGALDSAFRADTVSPVLDIKPHQTTKILIGGQFLKINGRSKLRIASLLGVTAPFDFDGDGRTDASVFRPSSSIWYELFSANSQVGQLPFGLTGDVACAADFDGDGKTDEAIFRPSSGEFWYSRSIDGAAVSKQFGQAGDVPRPSDFDGDGLVDFIVYRPSTSVWYRLGSTGQISVAQFGVSGDHPVVGDFDGDGRSDLAVFRPSTGDWWFTRSSSLTSTGFVHWGQTGDVPVPADYDGDGKTDVAVFRPSTGVWYALRSSDQSYLITAFGLSGDRPVPADYDGDGKADVAVFRPSNGVWYLRQSTAGTAGVQWGISGDVPLPNAFIP